MQLKFIQTIAQLKQDTMLPVNSPLFGLRKMERKDCKETLALLNKSFKKTRLFPVYTEDEFAKLFLTQKNIIYSFVVESDGKITDFISVYVIRTNVLAKDMSLNIGMTANLIHMLESIFLKKIFLRC